MELTLIALFTGAIAVVVATSILTVAGMSFAIALAVKSYERVENSTYTPGTNQEHNKYRYALINQEANIIREKLEDFVSSILKWFLAMVFTFTALGYAYYFFSTEGGRTGDPYYLDLSKFDPWISFTFGGHNLSSAFVVFTLIYCIRIVSFVTLQIKLFTSAAKMNQN